MNFTVPNINFIIESIFLKDSSLNGMEGGRRKRSARREEKRVVWAVLNPAVLPVELFVTHKFMGHRRASKPTPFSLVTDRLYAGRRLTQHSFEHSYPFDWNISQLSSLKIHFEGLSGHSSTPVNLTIKKLY